MKKMFLAIASLALVFGLRAATLTVTWTNGDNTTAVSNMVYYGTSSGVYTGAVMVPFAQTTVTLSNLASGVRYYVAAQCTDGMDASPYSNEANAKTKLNPPKNLNANAP